MDYKTQYQMYLSQASAALEDACAKFLPEDRRYAVRRGTACWAAENASGLCWCSVSVICWAVIRRRPELSALRWKCCTAIR